MQYRKGKIALCFYGQPRFIEDNYRLLFLNLIDRYEIDVYAHLWFDEELQTKPYKFGGNGGWVDKRIENDAIEKFCKIYNPKIIEIESSKVFLNKNIHFQKSVQRYYEGAKNNPLEPNFQERSINNIISRAYSLNSVNKMKKLYEYNNDFKYEWVISTRTDVILKSNIDLDKFKNKYLNFSNSQKQPDKMINDWFNFGSSEVMDCFMSIFDAIEILIARVCKRNRDAWCPELIHKEILKIYGIKSKSHPIKLELPRF